MTAENLFFLRLEKPAICLVLTFSATSTCGSLFYYDEVNATQISKLNARCSYIKG